MQKDPNLDCSRCPRGGAMLAPRNSDSCMLVSNSCLASAHSRKPCPTVSTMRAQQGIAESRCQPGPDFVFAQIVSHRRDQLIENVGVNLVERVAIERGKIISVRKFRWTFSIRSRAVEKFYDCPKRGCRRNCGDAQKWRRQFRSDRLAYGINVSRNPFVSFMAVNPEGDAPAFAYSRGQTRKTCRGIRQVVQNADGKCQIKCCAHRRIQQIANDYVRVWKLARVRKSYERAFAQIQRDNCSSAMRGNDGSVASFPTASFKDNLVCEIPGRQRGDPVEKFPFVIIAKIAPPRPFLGKTRSRLEFDAGEICRKQNRNAVANRKL